MHNIIIYYSQLDFYPQKNHNENVENRWEELSLPSDLVNELLQNLDLILLGGGGWDCS